jgi:hypothetical protein
VPEETAMKKTNVERTLSFNLEVWGVIKKQLRVNAIGTIMISGKINLMNRIDCVVNSTV